jgi:hypothetical protein
MFMMQCKIYSKPKMYDELMRSEVQKRLLKLVQKIKFGRWFSTNPLAWDKATWQGTNG